MILAAILGALFYAMATATGIAIGIYVSERIKGFDDGPISFNLPFGLLLAAGAIIGAIATTHLQSQGQILLTAIVCAALAAICVVDSRRGIVPDTFTLGPLALIVLVGIWNHSYAPLIAAAIPFVPFAAAAALSKGRGMGWGDAKLVALGGAVLGAQIALLAFIAACLGAALIAYLRGRRHEPIAFAPYLSGAIAAAIPIAMLL